MWYSDEVSVNQWFRIMLFEHLQSLHARGGILEAFHTNTHTDLFLFVRHNVIEVCGKTDDNQYRQTVVYSWKNKRGTP